MEKPKCNSNMYTPCYMYGAGAPNWKELDTKGTRRSSGYNMEEDNELNIQNTKPVSMRNIKSVRIFGEKKQGKNYADVFDPQKNCKCLKNMCKVNFPISPINKERGLHSVYFGAALRLNLLFTHCHWYTLLLKLLLLLLLC